MKQYAPLEGKDLAIEAKAFTESRFGQVLLKQLSLHYNALHQEAESEGLTVEQKVMKIERAAGAKWAIDYIMTRVKSLDEGYYDKKVVNP